MSFLFGSIIVTVGVLVILALPPAASERSWKRFLINLPLCFFGIMLPLFVFLLSAFLTPEWKGGCRDGWIDCFYTGKLALTPLVLWATAALYKVEVSRSPDRPWVAYGLLTGAVISSVCLLFSLGAQNGSNLEEWIAVPFYTVIWYSLRTVQVVANEKVKLSGVLKMLTGSAPFWGASVAWSYQIFKSLPVEPPGCFVVTAASRGHRNIVGPLLIVTHRGQKRFATRQLATFWAFEALWRNVSPLTHTAFRRGYNVVGPIIARRITSRRVADAIFIALKPIELFARLALNTHAVKTIKMEPRYLGCYNELI